MVGTAKLVDTDPVEETEKRMRQGFIDAIGQGGGAVRVQRKDEKTGNKYTCQPYELENEDYDQFLTELSNDFPDGGYFICTVTGPRGSVISNGVVRLDKNRRAKTTPAPAVQAVATQTDSGFEKYMMMVMDQQRHSSDMMFKMMMGVMQSLAGRPVEQSKESPLTLLNGVLEMHERLAPPRIEESNTIDKVLDTMGKLRAAFPEQAPAEGFAGTMQALAPLLAAAVAAQQGKQGAPPATPGVTGPQSKPPPAPGAPPTVAAAQSSAPTPESINTPEGQQLFLARIHPHVMAIKNLIDRGVNEDNLNLAVEDDASDLATEIANYIHMATRIMSLLEIDRDYLMEMYRQQPETIGPVLAMIGITEASHVQVIERAITLLGQQLAGEESTDGQGGDGQGA